MIQKNIRLRSMRTHKSHVILFNLDGRRVLSILIYPYDILHLMDKKCMNEKSRAVPRNFIRIDS